MLNPQQKEFIIENFKEQLSAVENETLSLSATSLSIFSVISFSIIQNHKNPIYINVSLHFECSSFQLILCQNIIKKSIIS